MPWRLLWLCRARPQPGLTLLDRPENLVGSPVHVKALIATPEELRGRLPIAFHLIDELSWRGEGLHIA